MKALQQSDSHCSSIISLLLKSNDHNINNEIKHYVMTDGLLYHISRPTRYEERPYIQLVNSKILTTQVIHEYHAGFGGGHFLFEKTYHKLKSRYFWPNSYKDTVEYVDKCDTCNRRMLRKKQAELQETTEAQFPFQILHIDLCGPYVLSSQGNNYILTAVDRYSNWIEAIPIPNKDSKTVAQALLQRVFCQPALPEYLVSDRGGEFTSELMDQLSTELKIKRIITSQF